MLNTDISNFKISSDMPTVIDVDSKITGDLEITTDVLVYGELIGSVKTEKKVVVGNEPSWSKIEKIKKEFSNEVVCAC